MVLVIGLDGATFDLLMPWLAEGHLPTMAGLVQQGCSGSLTSTMPPITAPAWATFMTGKNPGKHGIFDFFHPHSADLDKPTMVNVTDIKARPFWDYLSQAGVSAGVLNVPVTYPPQPVNGFLVPGLLSPDEGATTFPPNLLAEYKDELGSYRLVPHRLFSPDQAEAFITELKAVTETQLRYALRLAQEQPTDFLMVHFLAPDIAQHKFWQYLDITHPWFQADLAARFGTAVRDIFAQIDDGLAQLLSQLPSDTVVILMSDHGFGPQHEVVNLNNFFIQAGMMTLKQEARVRWRTWAFRHKYLASMMTRLARLWGRERLIGYADVDWAHTLAYSRGHMGQVYLNRQGREPQGIVALSEYTAVRERITDWLYTLRHPVSGQPLVDNVIGCEEAGAGPYQDTGPDLHVIMNGYRSLAYPLFAADGNLVTQQPLVDSGNHRLEGILIAAGPAVQSGQITKAHLVDLAPTILHLLGVPIPDDMDGRVLTDLFTTEFQQQHPITRQPAQPELQKPEPLTAPMQETLTEHLRSLGYLG